MSLRLSSLLPRVFVIVVVALLATATITFAAETNATPHVNPPAETAAPQILLVPDGFWGSFLHANLNSHLGTGAGWPKWYLGNVAVNYETFAISQPRVVGLLFFLWSSPNDPNFLGTKELPQSVRDRHREIACRNIGC